MWLQFCGLGDKTTIFSANSARVSRRNFFQVEMDTTSFRELCDDPCQFVFCPPVLCQIWVDGAGDDERFMGKPGPNAPNLQKVWLLLLLHQSVSQFPVFRVRVSVSQKFTKNLGDHNKIMSFRQVYAQVNPQQCSLFEHDRIKQSDTKSSHF